MLKVSVFLRLTHKQKLGIPKDVYDLIANSTIRLRTNRYCSCKVPVFLEIRFTENSKFSSKENIDI